MSADTTIATELRNIVGHKALVMLGAKDIFADGNDLLFRIRGSRKVSHIRIHLNSMDTLDVTYLKCSSKNGPKTVFVHEGIYNDMLHKSIEDNTQLRTSL